MWEDDNYGIIGDFIWRNDADKHLRALYVGDSKRTQQRRIKNANERAKSMNGSKKITEYFGFGNPQKTTEKVHSCASQKDWLTGFYYYCLYNGGIGRTANGSNHG
jgi:hypothetical protein